MSALHQLLTLGKSAMAKGNNDEIVALVRSKPKLFAELIERLWDENPGIVNRAASAVEELTREKLTTISKSSLQSYKYELLGLFREATTIKLRWNLALLVARLKLTLAEARQISATLTDDYLEDKSSIVRTCALQALYELSLQHPTLEPEAVEALQINGRIGTPAMRARSRILLKQIATGRHPIWPLPTRTT